MLRESQRIYRLYALQLEGTGMKYLILIIATEALVELWKKAAPLQDIKETLIARTPFLHSERMDTHLLECPYCLSVWFGAFVGFMYIICEASVYLFSLLEIGRASCRERV